MLRGLLVLGFLVSISAWGAPALDQAAQLYHRTDYEASLKLLQALPEKDAAVFDLIGFEKANKVKRERDTALVMMLGDLQDRVPLPRIHSQ